MSSRPFGDPRLQQAAALLHSLLTGGDRDGGSGQGPWHEVPSPTPEEPWLVSATDLLTNWSPHSPQTERLDPPLGHQAWDSYFEAPEPTLQKQTFQEQTFQEPAVPAEVPLPATAWPQVDLPPKFFEEEELDDDSAMATVECLYDFVHALGRGEIDQAMACIADDYHTIEDDEEVDRTALQQQLELLLDFHSGGEFDVSLTEVPEPVAFPGGMVVIPATIQLDARPSTGQPSSTLLARLAVLSRDEHGWRISALSPRPDLEAPTVGPEQVFPALNG